MDADYSIELGPTAPALEIPWRDPEGRLHYVELRGDPGPPDETVLRANVASIPEARQFPALGRFLVAVNSPESQWQTAKCDVWASEAGAAEYAAENLYSLGFEQHCYVDLVLAAEAASLRPSLEDHRLLAQELAQLLEADTALEATAEIVVRRCYFHHRGEGLESEAVESAVESNAESEVESEAGYCLTLFLAAYGSSAAGAAECGERAMDFAAECVRKLHPQHHPQPSRAKAQELG